MRFSRNPAQGDPGPAGQTDRNCNPAPRLWVPFWVVSANADRSVRQMLTRACQEMLTRQGMAAALTSYRLIPRFRPPA
jgi:hypothetical protein